MSELTKWKLNEPLTLFEFDCVLRELYHGAKKKIELNSSMDPFLYELYDSFKVEGRYNLTLNFSKECNVVPCICLEKNPRGIPSAVFNVNGKDVYLYERKK